jgi:exopolyphosphatase/guanosine-5'-triphosphate,3'-diphosphate pyrophosphatase
MRVGAIDIGSNSVRLLVTEYPRAGTGQMRVVTIARAGEACRLGKGLAETGRIDPATAERAAKLATSFAERARALGVENMVAAATAALRTAENGEEVARSIGDRCGLPVRILTGDEEARLIYRSVILGLGRSGRDSSAIVFDIGGGSTEVVSGVGGRPGRWTSLPFGAVSLSEKFITSDPPAESQMEALRAEVRGLIMHQCAYMPEKAPVLAGVGGTITVMAMLDRELRSYEPGLLEGWAITAQRLRELTQRICATTLAQRRRWPAMGEGRADIVVAGALAVSLLMERFPSTALVASTRGLRFALAYLAAEEAGGIPGYSPETA